MDATLVILAAGLSTRYGRLKQLEPVGPGGNALLDYGLFDALRAGFTRFVFIIREELEDAFREWGRGRWPSDLDVVYAHQRLGDLPAGWSVPPDREKPWGTGHALYSLRRELAGPFAVMNADDFYGASSFRILIDHLREGARRRPGPDAVPEWGMVGFTLKDTLSEFGGVSRGICRVGEDSFLREVVEVHRIRREEDGYITGVTEGGEPVFLTGSEVISRSLWSFTEDLLGPLEDLFLHFLEETSGQGGAEFLIPTVVQQLLSDGHARMRVMPAVDLSFGMTHPEDLEEVRGRLLELTRAGEYPERLFSGGEHEEADGRGGGTGWVRGGAGA